MICCAARADALQHGDAADLLEDEDARDARHGDAAEDDDDQADHAEVVLGAIEVLADLVVGRAERARVDELVLEVRRAASRTSGSIRFSGTRDEDHPPRPAAEPEQAGRPARRRGRSARAARG